ncbi:glutamate--tRNA ligase [Candidatus Jorgensenbacteria bacterium]|nr:glutamate--tRNA ligase [Candidatus Jorgensenbacteria bacterium]
MSVRVRFAPSPTGPFSLGNARTALFNWLFARHEGGVFLLRIEDTDKERSQKIFEDEICASLDWLGLTHSEDIVRQSERVRLYSEHLRTLIANHDAYYCFCSTQELEVERQAKLSQGLPPIYSGRCRMFSDDDVQERLKRDEKAVIRFRVPDKTVVFNDLVRGRIEFNASLLGDIIIAKNIQEPLYNFTAAVDDIAMGITHVIRGEDHLSNTPKQILIHEAFGWKSPHYAHLPLILGPDRKKLSKRFLSRSMQDYKNGGYLPDAMLNFLVLLGWHPERDREVLNRSEMAAEFSLKRVQKAGAVFNPEKLDWLNAHYIKTMPTDELLAHLKHFLPVHWLDNPLVKKIITIEQERMKSLRDFSSLASFFFELPNYSSNLLIWKDTPIEAVAENIRKVLEIIKAIPDKEFSNEVLERTIMALADEQGRGAVLWPLRVALSGQETSPPPIEIAGLLGKNETINRLNVALNKLPGGINSQDRINLI